MKAVKVLVFALLALPFSVLAQNFKINISDANFTRPLIEKWVTEYEKENPNFSIEIVNTADDTNSATLQVEVSEDQSKTNAQNVVKVGRYVLLPIANNENPVLLNKKFKKGFNENQLKELFVQKDELEDDVDEEKPKELNYTVYSRTGNHAETTNLFAHFLNINPNTFKGKKILGEDVHVLAAVLKDKDAVSFNTPNLIYNIDSRQPLKGISVLPIDLNNDGKVSEAERQLTSNLDALTSYLESNKNSSLPTDNINIVYNNKNTELEIVKFVDWVESKGQQYVNEYGFLSGQNNFVAQK